MNVHNIRYVVTNIEETISHFQKLGYEKESDMRKDAGGGGL